MKDLKQLLQQKQNELNKLASEQQATQQKLNNINAQLLQLDGAVKQLQDLVEDNKQAD